MRQFGSDSYCILLALKIMSYAYVYCIKNWMVFVQDIFVNVFCGAVQFSSRFDKTESSRVHRHFDIGLIHNSVSCCRFMKVFTCIVK